LRPWRRTCRPIPITLDIDQNHPTHVSSLRDIIHTLWLHRYPASYALDDGLRNQPPPHSLLLLRCGAVRLVR
jgi:hypothetical protein